MRGMQHPPDFPRNDDGNEISFELINKTSFSAAALVCVDPFTAIVRSLLPMHYFNL